MTNREKRAVTDKLAEMATYYNRRFSENGSKTGGAAYRRLQGALKLAKALELPHEIIQNGQGYITHIVYAKGRLLSIKIPTKN